MSNQNDFLTLPEAQKELGYHSIRSIYNLIKNGRLQKYRLLNKSVVSRDDVKALKQPQPVN